MSRTAPARPGQPGAATIVSFAATIARSVCGIARAASTMMNTSLASVFASQGDVFFAGWRAYDLVDGLNCADLLTAHFVDEPFGLIYPEAMVEVV